VQRILLNNNYKLKFLPIMPLKDDPSAPGGLDAKSADDVVRQHGGRTVMREREMISYMIGNRKVYGQSENNDFWFN
jgi:hypothetical protein